MKLLYVILKGNKGERKKRKMAPVDRYTVPVLKWLTGHNVSFHLGFEF